jgi:RNA polymerase sigma factor (sigma-70 family)
MSARGGALLDEAAKPPSNDEIVRRLLRARVDSAYRLAAFILHDPLAAEDAVQEAALLAWDRRRTLRDPARADGWFTQIVVNVCRDELRRRTRRPRLVTLDPEAHGELGPAGTAISIAPALARLTPDEQTLLALRYGSDLTVADIASQLGVPDGTIKSRLHAALEHLRAAVDAERRQDEAR